MLGGLASPPHGSGGQGGGGDAARAVLAEPRGQVSYLSGGASM